MIKHRDCFFKEKLQNYTNILLIPFCVLIGIFLLTGLLSELIFGFGTGDTLGETTGFGTILLSIGNVFSKVLFIAISGIVSMSLGDETALAGGILGGYLVTFGYSYSFPSGSITGSFGLFGAILSGIIAGGTVKLLRIFFGDLKKSSDILYAFMSIILTLFLTLAMGSIAEIINSACTMTLGALMNYENPLVYVLLGVFVSVNPGSGMYISALSFSSAMISSGEFTPAAAVISASLAPVVSLFITCLFIWKSLYTAEKISYLSGAAFGVGGISVSAVPYYLLHPFKAILSFSLGSILSSYLTYMFSAGAENLTGGFLSAYKMHRPWLILLAVFCGGLLSAAINILLTKIPKKGKHQLYK